ncbi:MAG TPA: HDIG domain-containing protein [Polyangiaceae bacterium]|nr:HDIG domain-containing protein [Polyangiaceae bacterium]
MAAIVLTTIHSGDLFVRSWVPSYDERVHTALRIPYGPRLVRDWSSGRAEIRFENFRVVVPPGEVLLRSREDHRAAYLYEWVRRPPAWQRIGGVFFIYFTLMMALTAYLRKFGQSRLRLMRSQVGVLLAIGLVAVTAKLLLLFTALPEYWIPAAAVPLWVSTAFDRRTGFVVSVVLAFIVASFLRLDLLLLVAMMAQGLAATLILLDRKRPGHLIGAGILSGVSVAAVLVAVTTVIEGKFDPVEDGTGLLDSRLLAAIGGGILAGVVAAVLRGSVQRILGHVSRERLLDLTDLEQPLLKKMAREAPGSWEHSRAMANLAEGAASAIGADALLTRVGAYYHDLGKTTQAKYFVENLALGERSPHEALEPDVSADAIMAHVVMGAKILRDGGVPEPVVEFCYTHHGTQVVEYFWNKCLEQGNPKHLRESHFRYPGMKPQTKETAILMLVDSIEAASRTIDPPEREKFEVMIQRVLFTKLKSGQLDESGLTVEDLRTLVTRMTETLVNMHHHRIKYQWQAQQAEEFGVPSQVARETASSPVSAPVPRPPAASSSGEPSAPPDAVDDANASPEIQVTESVLPAGASLLPLGDARRGSTPDK